MIKCDSLYCIRVIYLTCVTKDVGYHSWWNTITVEESMKRKKKQILQNLLMWQREENLPSLVILELLVHQILYELRALHPWDCQSAFLVPSLHLHNIYIQRWERENSRTIVSIYIHKNILNGWSWENEMGIYGRKLKRM